MKTFVGLYIFFMSFSSFAGTNYKCSYIHTKLKISEEFELNGPDVPVDRSSIQKLQFIDREIIFNFMKSSTSGIPDTLNISILNGESQNHDLQFFYPLSKIYWRTEYNILDSESLYCYDLKMFP